MLDEAVGTFDMVAHRDADFGCDIRFILGTGVEVEYKTWWPPATRKTFGRSNTKPSPHLDRSSFGSAD